MKRLSLHPPGGRSGFSLVEVVIALALFVIGAYGIIDLLDQSRHLEDVSQKRLQAVALAQSKLSELRAAGYEAVQADLTGKAPKLPVAAPADVVNGAMRDLAWQVQVVPAAIPEAALVTVGVSWNPDGAKGFKAPADSRLTLTELIAKPSVGQGGNRGK
jgi:prepilin-type N-terminal cleavage/methylation domain-containing protein